MMGIIAGVTFHFLSEWADSPISFLGALFELHIEKMFDQMAEAELAQAEQAGGEHGVKDGGGNELVMFAQQTQIVIGAVHDQLMAGEAIEQRIEIYFGEGINEIIARNGADLD